MFLDIFICLQKVIIVVNMVTRKNMTKKAHLKPTRISTRAFLLVRGIQPSTFFNKKNSW